MLRVLLTSTAMGAALPVGFALAVLLVAALRRADTSRAAPDRRHTAPSGARAAARSDARVLLLPVAGLALFVVLPLREALPL